MFLTAVLLESVKQGHGVGTLETNPAGEETPLRQDSDLARQLTRQLRSNQGRLEQGYRLWLALTLDWMFGTWYMYNITIPLSSSYRYPYIAATNGIYILDIHRLQLYQM